jgi:hypothetical protein
MVRKSKKQKNTRGSGLRRNLTRVGNTGEWVGAATRPPFSVHDSGELVTPELLVWMEVRSELVVGQHLTLAETVQANLGSLLVSSIEAPLIGLPRRPSHVRVASSQEAESVRAALPDMEVTVAPIPEIDQLVDMMAASFAAQSSGDPWDYLSLLDATPAVVRSLFDASADLWTAPPWRAASDWAVLRIDAPSIGISGACLSIIGALGEDFGFVLFPSSEDFLEYLEHAQEASQFEPGAEADIGSSFISLNFERGADLPKPARRKIARHHLEVAAPDAYPMVMSVTRNGEQLAPGAQDLIVLTACARGLAAFHAQHHELFFEHQATPATLELTTEEGVELHVSGPHDLDNEELFDSGYPPSPLRVIDQGLAEKIVRAAVGWYGDLWWREFVDDDDLLDPPDFGMPIVIYHVDNCGETLGDRLASSGEPLDVEERALLDAHRQAWLSIWEVTAVEDEVGITVVDCLTGERRFVNDLAAADTATAGAHLLARIVTSNGESILAGVHPGVLSPLVASEVVERARKRLKRKRKVPTERLRDPRFCYALIAYWEDAASARADLFPQLHNTDGDALLVTVDHFTVVQGHHDAVHAALDDMPDADPPEADVGPQALTWHFTRKHASASSPMDSVLVGRAILHDGRLELETNSIPRADDLRQRIETALGPAIKHRVREHSDPISAPLMEEMEQLDLEADFEPPEDITPAKLAIIQDYKRQHYESWPDHAIPALGDQTPREAMKTRHGKDRVGALIREMEFHEARLPVAERADFSVLRKTLGLE